MLHVHMYAVGKGGCYVWRVMKGQYVTYLCRVRKGQDVKYLV
jgi:hypothetical protein